MAYKLPEHRLPKHILLTRIDAWALREIIKPNPWPDDAEDAHVNEFCNRLYNALLHIELEGRGEWNIEMTAEMVYVVNNMTKSGMWEGADGILIQSWMALHEILFPNVEFELPSEMPVSLVTEEKADAVCEEGVAAEGAGQPEAGDGGGAKLSYNRAIEGVYFS